MTRFDFDVIGDSPRLISRPPDKIADKATEAERQKLPQDHTGDHTAPVAKAQKPAA